MTFFLWTNVIVGTTKCLIHGKHCFIWNVLFLDKSVFFGTSDLQKIIFYLELFILKKYVIFLELVTFSGKIMFYLEYVPIGQICFLWN